MDKRGALISIFTISIIFIISIIYNRIQSTSVEKIHDHILINENLMGSVDIKNCPWIDIDTPEALKFINENPKKFTE